MFKIVNAQIHPRLKKLKSTEQRTMYQERYSDISPSYVIRMPIKRNVQKADFFFGVTTLLLPTKQKAPGNLYYTRTSLALGDSGQLSPGGGVAPVLIGHCNGTKRTPACLQTHTHRAGTSVQPLNLSILL